ncbi:SCP2 sterol-binding domain-containing protein [Modicisalibacter tunisiensis]|uniref:ubiquinone biosynthesis accessory factor UbiJ n=1 Tax=Modicisalibacter tunisiensis TaxID=390637 RepID=UPI001CCA26A4|nr:SCP2 sterol-binding domain-containing protein [Modicisalibacter tunisiensis]MBZ9539133.1 SCP2 sterol-binding domain-containing protein [Modicisalibacter tunisiensis]
MALTPVLLLACAEKTFNSLLARDPAAPGRLRRLAGKRLLLRLERPSLALLVTFHTQGLGLLHAPQAEETDADAVVEADCEALGSLLAGESLEQLMFSGRLSLRGQTHLLEATRELLMDLDLDWEAALAEWFGDVPAHSLAEGLRRFARFGLRSQHELRADLSEYVFEEARLLPGQAQREVLRDHLTELEVATDRLEARLARLQRKLDARRREPTT